MIFVEVVGAWSQYIYINNTIRYTNIVLNHPHLQIHINDVNIRLPIRFQNHLKCAPFA